VSAKRPDMSSEVTWSLIKHPYITILHYIKTMLLFSHHTHTFHCYIYALPETNRYVSLWASDQAFPRLPPGSDLAADLVTRGSNHFYAPTFLSGSAGMLLSDVVMGLRRNVARWTRDIDDGYITQLIYSGTLHFYITATILLCITLWHCMVTIHYYIAM